MKNHNEKIIIKNPQPVYNQLTMGDDISVTHLIKMTETICNFYSGYPDVKDNYKASCPDCPLSIWFCDKLSTLTDEYLRVLCVEYGKIITLKRKYNVSDYDDYKNRNLETTVKK